MFQIGDIARLKEEYRIDIQYHYLMLEDYSKNYYTSLCLETGKIHVTHKDAHYLEWVA